MISAQIFQQRPEIVPGHKQEVSLSLLTHGSLSTGAGDKVSESRPLQMRNSVRTQACVHRALRPVCSGSAPTFKHCRLTFTIALGTTTIRSSSCTGTTSDWLPSTVAFCSGTDGPGTSCWPVIISKVGRGEFIARSRTLY